MSAQVYTLSPPVTPGPRAWPTLVAPPLEGRWGAVVAVPPALTTGGPVGPEEGVGGLPGDRRRMAAALLLATALNAIVVWLPPARGPGEAGSGPPPPISVLLAVPATRAGQGTAASLDDAVAAALPVESHAAVAPESGSAPQPETQSLGGAPEPGRSGVPPQEPAMLPAATPAHLEPVPTQPSLTERSANGPSPAEPSATEPAPADPVSAKSLVPPAPRPTASRATRTKPAATLATESPGRNARKAATAGPPGVAAADPGAAAAPSGAGDGRVAGAGVPSPAVDTEAVPIVRVAPAYPLAARTHRTEGRVLVEFTIQADGSVADPTVVEASPAGVFDRAVLQAIRQWRFAPRVEDGQVVSRRARQTVQFSLSS